MKLKSNKNYRSRKKKEYRKSKKRNKYNYKSIKKNTRKSKSSSNSQIGGTGTPEERGKAAQIAAIRRRLTEKREKTTRKRAMDNRLRALRTKKAVAVASVGLKEALERVRTKGTDPETEKKICTETLKTECTKIIIEAQESNDTSNKRFKYCMQKGIIDRYFDYQIIIENADTIESLRELDIQLQYEEKPIRIKKTETQDILIPDPEIPGLLDVVDIYGLDIDNFRNDDNTNDTNIELLQENLDENGNLKLGDSFTKLDGNKKVKVLDIAVKLVGSSDKVSSDGDYLRNIKDKMKDTIKILYTNQYKDTGISFDNYSYPCENTA